MNFSALFLPVHELGWKLNHLSEGPKGWSASIRERGEWQNGLIQDYGRIVQGFGPTPEIAIARAVISAKEDLTPRPKPVIDIKLEDLDL